MQHRHNLRIGDKPDRGRIPARIGLQDREDQPMFRRMSLVNVAKKTRR